ncbi:hypothetical protein Acr_15g0013860 [Actinidia rufa]|uniref:Retrovirus-related Pol polyprotein from transposon TNT 1-94-like beta-barrel domain-containing protein n=1 Tax=Actinidia rufa TaxID=165716 RepID=A0A7J0FXX1_9ERIC|nr:hypothetical protein Acr_15g0013860 [Actinidia rufa]
MYQAKTSRNKALLMRRLVNLKLQRGTVAEHTSPTAFEFFARELGDIGGFSQQFCAGWEVDYEVQSRMPCSMKSHGRQRWVSSADENPDWILDSENAYYFCRDREIFSTYATCEGLVRMANNTTNKVVGKGIV